MPPDFLDLLRRDHRELELQLALLADPSVSPIDRQAAFDAVVLGLTAHAEAELIALLPLANIVALQTLIAELHAEHLMQEQALAALICAPLGSGCARERSEALRELIHHHAVKEETYLPPAIRAHAAPELNAQLAATYATERLRQLSTLHSVECDENLAPSTRAPM